MDKLKLYSLRMDCQSLDWAKEIARRSCVWKCSDVVRLSIWIGSKVITSRCLPELMRLMVRDTFWNSEVTIDDILHTGGIKLENLKKEE